MTSAELIAEARNWGRRADCRPFGEVMRDLADALEHKSGLADEYLELMSEEQLRHNAAMDALFLDRKRLEKAIRDVLGLIGDPGPRAREILEAALRPVHTNGGE